MLESPIQVALLFGAALIVFGPKKLPELGKALGQGIGNFKRSLQEAQQEVKNAVNQESQPGQPAQPEDSCCSQPSSTTAATTVRTENPKNTV